MSRGRRNGRIAAPLVNECHRCGEDMKHTSDMAKVRGRWVHRWCAGGGDDE